MLQTSFENYFRYKFILSDILSFILFVSCTSALVFLFGGGGTYDMILFYLIYVYQVSLCCMLFFILFWPFELSWIWIEMRLVNLLYRLLGICSIMGFFLFYHSEKQPQSYCLLLEDRDVNSWWNRKITLGSVIIDGALQKLSVWVNIIYLSFFLTLSLTFTYPVFYFVLISGLGSDDEVELVNHLFVEQGYNPLIRPVRELNETINVKFGLALIQLINVVSVFI